RPRGLLSSIEETASGATMRSVLLLLLLLLLFLVEACGGASRTVEFADDAGPAPSEDAASLTGLDGSVGARCGTQGGVHGPCPEALVCMTGVCELPSASDASGAADAVGHPGPNVDAMPAGEADTGTASGAHPAGPILSLSQDHACLVRGGKVE